MNQSYKIILSETQAFELTADEAQSLDAVQNTDGTFHILQNGQAMRARVVSGDRNSKQYTVEVNGNSYPVRIADRLDMLVDKMGLSAGVSQKVSDVKAPMPGLVLEVSVVPGTAVAKGDALLILEAMKMENVLKAQGDGVVKNVHIKQGDAVEKSQLLIEME